MIFSRTGAPHRPLTRRRIRTLISCSVALITLTGLTACTPEQQNKLGREIQTWTGTDGVLEVYAGDKLVKRFIKIEKLSSAYDNNDKQPRPYRYGYGVLDENLNGVADPGEKRVYFEISDYSTSYVFYENPH